MNKSTDEVVEQVLQGLASVQPSPGFEERVMAGIRSRGPSRVSWTDSFRRRVRSAPWQWGFGLTAASLVAAATLFNATHRPVSSNSASGHPVQGTTVPHGTAALTSAVAEENSSRMATPSAKPQQPRPVTIAARRPQALGHTPPAAPCHCDSLAMEEWRAPSQPAPELPLTHEERLLQGFAYRGDTDELAALTPAFRAAEHAREQAEFQHFFNKPTTGDTE